MQIKGLILLVVLWLLNGCSSSPKPEVIVVDKSINLELVEKQPIAPTKPIKKIFKQTPIHKMILSKPNKPIADEQKQITKPPKKNTEEIIKNWSFPVIGRVIKPFSAQHSGITFDTQLGQAVRTIANGVVIYSGNTIKKHGKMVIIKHSLGFYSSYTQNGNLIVKLGDTVKQGRIIALTGKTDFYFEMKKFKTPIDPLKYLK